MNRVERKEWYYNQIHKIIDGVIYRKCSQCQEWKVESEEFYLRNKSKPEKGYKAECKSCTIKRSYKNILDNRERFQSYYKNWHQENKESHNANKKRWHQEHRKQRQEDVKRFYALNPDKQREHAKNHRNHDITEKEWIACKDYFKDDQREWCCAYCGMTEKEHKNIREEQLHKEHVVHDGENDLSNCVPSCYICNSSKWQFNMEEWFRKQEYFSEDKLNKINLWCTDKYKDYIRNKK